jgi:small subunit ribosomal protein S17
MTIEKKEKNRKKIKGVVFSTKMKDTAVVLVSRIFKHSKYEKTVKKSKKYKVHDPENTLKVGESVEIIETKPISKTKRFIVA